jgi:DNA-binding CsgD family transcriptional regulator
MIRSDDEWLNLADEFYGAGVMTNGWHRALEGLAAATGSRSGELICISGDGTAPTHVVTNVDPEALQHFDQARGGMPQVNPRVEAGFSAKLLQPVTEADFITPEDHRRHPHYREFAFPWDLAFICLTTLHREPGMTIGMSVIRSQREGHINDEQKRIFATLAPHVRAAVRMQQLLGSNGASLVAGTLDSMSIAAFLCDQHGRVQRMTQPAEKLVSGGGPLRLRNGFLGSPIDNHDRALGAAIEQAARGAQTPGKPLARSILVNVNQEQLTLDVLPLPKAAIDFSLQPRVVVIVRGASSNDTRRAGILSGIFGLTEAETQIALLLAQGKAAEAIARERQVTVGTVRAQIKSLLAKFGVSKQIELVARVNNL